MSNYPAKLPALRTDESVAAYKAEVASVADATTAALTTHQPNQFVMIYEGKDPITGQTIKRPYVLKDGLSLRLNEYAADHRGIASMRFIMVRSQFETQKSLLDVFAALPDEMKKSFLAERNNDMTCLTLPDGHSCAHFRVIFGDGKTWEGTAIANKSNVSMSTLYSRLDEMARVRAFCQTIRFAMAGGFIPSEAIHGEKEEFSVENLQRQMEEAGITLDDLEVAEAGEESFLEDLDPNGSGEVAGVQIETPRSVADLQSQDSTTQGGAGIVESGSGHEQVASGLRSEDGRAKTSSQGASVPEINDLLKLAKTKNVNLLTLCKENYEVGSFGLLTAEQKIELHSMLTAAVPRT